MCAGSKLTSLSVGVVNCLGFVRAENNLVFIMCAGRNDLFFCTGSKMTWFLVWGPIDLVFVFLVEMDLVSVLGH